MSRGHWHTGDCQNTGNVLGDRSCVRQSKFFRMYESGNQIKSLLGQEQLVWDTNRKQGAYSGQRVYDGRVGSSSTTESYHPVASSSSSSYRPLYEPSRTVPQRGHSVPPPARLPPLEDDGPQGPTRASFGGPSRPLSGPPHNNNSPPQQPKVTYSVGRQSSSPGGYGTSGGMGGAGGSSPSRASRNSRPYHHVMNPEPELPPWIPFISTSSSSIGRTSSSGSLGINRANSSSLTRNRGAGPYQASKITYGINASSPVKKQSPPASRLQDSPQIEENVRNFQFSPTSPTPQPHAQPIQPQPQTFSISQKRAVVISPTSKDKISPPYYPEAYASSPIASPNSSSNSILSPSRGYSSDRRQNGVSYGVPMPVPCRLEQRLGNSVGSNPGDAGPAGGFGRRRVFSENVGGAGVQTSGRRTSGNLVNNLW